MEAEESEMHCEGLRTRRVGHVRPSPSPSPQVGKTHISAQNQAERDSPSLTEWCPSTLEKAICFISPPIQILIPPSTLRNTTYSNIWACYGPAKFTHKINGHKAYIYSPGNNEKAFSRKLFFQKYALSITACGDVTGSHFMFLKKPWTLWA